MNRINKRIFIIYLFIAIFSMNAKDAFCGIPEEKIGYFDLAPFEDLGYRTYDTEIISLDRAYCMSCPDYPRKLSLSLYEGCGNNSTLIVKLPIPGPGWNPSLEPGKSFDWEGPKSIGYKNFGLAQVDELNSELLRITISESYEGSLEENVIFDNYLCLEDLIEDGYLSLYDSNYNNSIRIDLVLDKI